MKIKKSELKIIIEQYLNEITPGIIDPSSGGGGMRAVVQGGSPSGIGDTIRKLKWPQDFVIFEDAFEHHVKSWQSFSKTHPKSAFFIQLIDMSGVSAWGDMAKSIEDIQNPNASQMDHVMYFLNLLSSTPIAFLLSLSGGRLITWIANKILPLAQGGNMSVKLAKIANSTDEFAQLFQNVAEVKLFKGNISKITKKLVELKIITPQTATKIVNKTDDIFNSIKSVLSGLDSFAFRVFAKFFIVVADKISEGFAKAVMEFYMLRPDMAEKHAQLAIDLGEYIYKNSPDVLQDAIDMAEDAGENIYDMLSGALGLN